MTMEFPGYIARLSADYCLLRLWCYTEFWREGVHCTVHVRNAACLERACRSMSTTWERWTRLCVEKYGRYQGRFKKKMQAVRRLFQRP